VTAVPKSSFSSFQDFLEWEQQQEERYEYTEGQVFAMSGGTYNHSVVAQSIGAALMNGIKVSGKNCTVANCDLKVFIEAFESSCYPDVMVVCGSPEFHKKNQSVITNPLLIVEVLSSATASYDRGTKFMKYRSLPSFREYLLVAQDEPKVESWTKKEENLWQISNATGLDSKVHLFSLGIDLLLEDIHNQVVWE
jgi:Uma2 family endonuclease